MATFAAVVVAGGAGRRLGGLDKPALVIGSTTLLDRALAAVVGADPVVVVGPARPSVRQVRWTVERPPGGGPVAALAAGLDMLRELAAAREPRTAPPAANEAGNAEAGNAEAVDTLTVDTEVAVLAADLLAVGPGTIDRLRAALAREPAAAGALLVDADGRRQWLTGVWRLGALRAALPADPAGAALRAVLGGLTVVEVAERTGETDDVDTPADLARARRLAGEAG